jgi:hypothetical protein
VGADSGGGLLIVAENADAGVVVNDARMRSRIRRLLVGGGVGSGESCGGPATVYAAPGQFPVAADTRVAPPLLAPPGGCPPRWRLGTGATDLDAFADCRSLTVVVTTDPLPRRRRHRHPTRAQTCHLDITRL